MPDTHDAASMTSSNFSKAFNSVLAHSTSGSFSIYFQLFCPVVFTSEDSFLYSASELSTGVSDGASALYTREYWSPKQSSTSKDVI